MAKAADYRIQDVQKARVNGQDVKTFSAFRRDGDRFVHVGQFSAPVQTADSTLWKIADAAKDEASES